MASSCEISAAGRLVEGNPDSPVRVIVYEDLQCSDCAGFRRMMDEHLLPGFAARVAFEHRDFPLDKHPWARKAAVAARFFEKVGPELGLQYRRHTLANIATTTTSDFEEKLAVFAKARGLDEAATTASLRDPSLEALVQADFQEGSERGVAKTPTVFVHNRTFIETFSVEEITQALEAAAAGVRP